MQVEKQAKIEVIKATTTKINEVDFEKLSFGTVFTDHMLVCDYENGAWQKTIIQPYAPFTMDPASRVFHYGQAIFEGMKAYRTEQDEIWLFRADENFKRMNKSAVRLAMPEISEEIFIEGLKELIRLDNKWVKKGRGNALYIRPFMIATGTGVSASPSNKYRFCILLSPVKSYFAGEVRVVIADHYSRAANGGIGAAKAAGNYAAQFYPTQLANQEGFQQVIWTDDTTHTKLEEAGTMNVWFRIGDTLYTAPASDRILDGITRKSLIELAKHLGIKAEVRSVTVSELIEAHQNNTLLEVFGSGTAAVVSPIVGFSYEGVYYEIPKTSNTFSAMLKEKLNDIQYKTSPDIFGWTTRVL